MPAVLDRYENNLAVIADFSDKYDVPVTVLWWRQSARAFIDMVIDRTGFDLPVVCIPSEYKNDRRNWCAGSNDCHPAAWATRIIALGLLDLLS